VLFNFIRLVWLIGLMSVSISDINQKVILVAVDTSLRSEVAVAVPIRFTELSCTSEC